MNNGGSPDVKLDATTLQLRTSKGSLISFFLVVGWIPFLFVGLHINRPGAFDLTFHGITFGALLLGFLWLRAFKLEIDSQEVRYFSLFGGKESIPLTEIGKIKWKVFERNDSPTQPPIRLEITPKRGSTAQKLIINAKPFPRDGLAEFVRRVEACVASRRSTLPQFPHS